MMTDDLSSGRGAGPLQLHASAVSVAGHAVLLKGPSGTGKSTLALQLMAFGAALIADDRTDILLQGGWPTAACPEPIRGRLEARGVGVLAVEAGVPAPIHLVVDMERTETLRLPPERNISLLGQRIRLLHKAESVLFAPALLQYLKVAGKGFEGG